MRYLLALLLLMSLLHAQETTQKITIGAGPYVQTQPYKDTSEIFVPSPVVFFDNSLFYVRWTQVGLYFLGGKQEDYSWGLSLTAQPRPYGYEASDSDFLHDMDTRENTLEGGLSFITKSQESYFEIMALTDLLDRYESWIVKAELGTEYSLGKFTFYPSLICIYQSDKFVDYYYGVKTSEVDASIGRNFYSPKGGFQLGAQSYINYPLNENWSIFSNVRIDKLTEDAVDSPLTEDAYIYSGLVSLIYTFEY